MSNPPPSIPHEVREEIMRRLAAAASEHDVRILMAIESGSRAWGFASTNSDFDVRFIYARPADWYQRIDLEEQRDVIEYPIVDDIDLNGWDLRKALRLFWKSNPPFVEWIQSPIVYINAGGFAASARRILPEVYSLESGIHHYRSMAKGCHADHLRTPTVKLKRYFYALRPLLCVRWIERYAAAPPIEFDRMLHLLDGEPELLGAINDLLALKRVSTELGEAPAVPILNAFIEAELLRLETVKAERTPRPGATAHLNGLFQETLRELN